MAGSGFQVRKIYDRFDEIIISHRQHVAKFPASYARKGAEMMAARAPRSNINTPGYVHFADRFQVVQVAESLWAIINDKIVNGYALWKLLENGTPRMAPRKTIGPVMDIIGPEYLREIKKVQGV